MNKEIKILQPAKIGDIIICLPIAKCFYDMGYTIYWPISAPYLNLMDYVDYVVPVGVRQGDDICSHDAKAILPQMQVLDLLINFSAGNPENQRRWENSKLSFDEWKYHVSQVPFSEKYNLKIKRNEEKEDKLKNVLNIHKYKDDYVVVHANGSKGRYNFNIAHENIVEIFPCSGYTVFDWVGIIEGAKEVYCVDSCISHVVNQLGLCKGRRYFKSYIDKFRSQVGSQFDYGRMLVPKMAEDWILL